MRIFSAAVAALMCLSLSANAFAADIKLFTADTAEAIATAAGGTNVQRKTSGDQTIIVFDYKGGRYIFSLELCSKDDKSKCAALLMASGFKTTASDTLEVFNEFNKAVGFLTAVKLDGQTMAFGRYVVALGGISAENVGANFGLLTVAPEIYADFVGSQVVASSGTAGEVTLSQPDAASAALQPIELTPEQVKSMATDAYAAKAKLN